MSRTVIRYAVVSALGGLLFGFDTAVISGTTTALERVFDLSSTSLGFTVAIALIGTIVGAVIASRPADRLGRRPTLVIIAALYLVSAIGSALANSWVLFLIARFVGGIGVGAASVVSPMYTAEISPAEHRGRLVALVQFNIVFGILLAFASNYVLTLAFPEDVAWRWMFGVEALPAAVFLALLATVRESPRWLIDRGRDDEAREILHILEADDVDARVDEIQGALAREERREDVRLLQRAYLTPVLLALAIAAFNQLSGINAVLYYAPDIFRSAGAGDNAANLQSIVVGATNMVFTLIALWLIDRAGRRRLMLIGSVGYVLGLSGVAWAFFTSGEDLSAVAPVVLGGLMVFIAAHAIGQGAVIWVFISEIFPTEVRAKGQALGAFVHWTMNAVIAQLFPVFAEQSGGFPFAIFAVFMVGQLVWVLKVMPETKGVPLEKMRDRLKLPPADRRAAAST